MLDAFSINTISYIFLLGALVMILGRQLPVRLILIVAGCAMSMVMVEGMQIFYLSREMLYIILALSLPLMVFDSFSIFRPGSWHTSTFMAFRTDSYQLIASTALVGILAYAIFPGMGLIPALFTGIIITIASPYDSHRQPPSLHRHLLEDEARISSALALTATFVIISFLLFPQGMHPILHILSGFGIGIIMGFVTFRLCYHEGPLNHLILLLSIILTYMISHLLTASGVFAVAGLGIFYGAVITKRKGLLEEYTRGTIIIAEILLFASLGIIAHIPFTWMFLLKVLAIYALFLIVRYLSLRWTHHDFPDWETRALLFMSPKGAPVAAIALSLEVFGPHSLRLTIPLITGVVMISLLTSYIYGLIYVREKETKTHPVRHGVCSVRKPQKGTKKRTDDSTKRKERKHARKT